jgi:hypothetical protein
MVQFRVMLKGTGQSDYLLEQGYAGRGSPHVQGTMLLTYLPRGMYSQLCIYAGSNHFCT